MHGRLKVKTTEEQEKARQLEQDKKVKAYQTATSRIFAKRVAGELDIEALQLSGAVLAKNPDVYSLWNYRKEIYLHLIKSLPETRICELFDEELSFLVSCLTYNPKSYGSWEHRCFVLLHHPKADWERELTLCNKFLTYDERNFHCWDYRRFVIKHSKVTAEEELNFTFEKIASNFSNYSSWHYRSKLLPQIHGSCSGHSSGLTQSILHQEMELVQNAFFTDPNDQSAWFYHRWLLGRVERPMKLLDVNSDGARVVLTFSVPVKVLDNESVSWTAPSDQGYSCVWFCSNHTSNQSVRALYNGEEKEFDTFHAETATGLKDAYFRRDVTAATTDVLDKELESCQELFELEPENKWVLLTIVLLMNSLDPDKYEDEITHNLQKLMLVDSYRANYYRDLQSRFIWEKTLMGASPSIELDLSHRHLTSLYHQNLLYTVVKLDLSNNKLTSLQGINYLQRLQSLNLSNNRICSSRGLRNMSNLVYLNISNNMLTDREAVDETIATCRGLTEIQLDGNPWTLTDG
ncbi:geranylgeranyl transferase type-2 subunit alpha-like [Watersipora subatra]|uniref:geranylgeranyl transferase type-2 subunit alpha-like n=1 Tax=Watersipora subatra TaxID=2589382 RepID=UPI00355C159D